MLLCFRRLEARGEIRGGRFVSGFSGEQFALPEAVAPLRAARRQGPIGEMVAIDASDPLNLIGTIVPGDRIPVTSRDRILLRDGVPIATQSDREVRFIADLDSGEQWQARNALVQPVPGLSNRTH
jgi:ATP-dependent Lhr-like helicase